MNIAKYFKMKNLFGGNPQQMMSQALSLLVPMLDNFMGKFNQPEDEGGLLQDGDHTCCIGIVPTKVRNGEGEETTYLPYVLTLAYDPASARMYISNKILLTKILEEDGSHPAGGIDEEE